jgi:hypothetical protein
MWQWIAIACGLARRLVCDIIDISINNAMIRAKKYEGLSDECSREVMAAIGQRS